MINSINCSQSNVQTTAQIIIPLQYFNILDTSMLKDFGINTDFNTTKASQCLSLTGMDLLSGFVKLKN